MNSPKQYYASLIKALKLEEDKGQGQVVEVLESIYQGLLSQNIIQSILRKLFKRKQVLVKGLYLWGGVGIGKTLLMDIFNQSVGTLRMHFHVFMQHIHHELKQLAGKKDPLKVIAKQIAKKNKVICFDEFFVSDITDAMILGNLFSALFKEGVTLVATSNIAPDDLYKGGISRDRFLPAIELIKSHTQVIHLTSNKDYRMRVLQGGGVYLTPLNEFTQKQLSNQFEQLADHLWTENELLTIEGRTIRTYRKGNGIIWFHFRDLCHSPRSQVDYIEIAKSFHTVFVSHVPKLKETQIDEVIYLINLVDIFYDAKVKLILSAECSIEELYQKGEMQFEFKRTKSRLHEMQSLEYLRKMHVY